MSGTQLQRWPHRLRLLPGGFGGLATTVTTPPTAERCPWCGAAGKTTWGTCLTCSRFYLATGWPTGSRRRRRVRWITLGLGLLMGVCAWLAYPFVPDPWILASKPPSTMLSSNSGAQQWAMSGFDLQQRRYVHAAPQQPEGRLLWSVDLGRPTRSVPVVVDDTIYIGADFRLVALDASTGRERWTLPTTGPVHTSPAAAGDRLYVGLQDWRVLAVDRLTGTMVWQFSMQDGVAGSPSVAQGIVYIGSMDGFLYALDAANGTLIWKFKTQGQALSPPAIDAGRLFLSSTDGSLYAMRARTGQSWLRYRTPARLHDSPVAANGLVYFPSGGRLFTVAANAYEFPGQYQLTLVWAQFWLWQFPIPRPPGQPGSRWRFSPPHPAGGIVSSPAVTPEALYVGDTNGYVYARHALTGEALWQFKAGAAIMASPVMVGQRLYVSAIDGYLYALDRSDAELAWKLRFGAALHATPVFAHGRLYIRTSDGWLHAVE